MGNPVVECYQNIAGFILVIVITEEKTLVFCFSSQKDKCLCTVYGLAKAGGMEARLKMGWDLSCSCCGCFFTEQVIQVQNQLKLLHLETQLFLFYFIFLLNSKLFSLFACLLCLSDALCQAVSMSHETQPYSLKGEIGRGLLEHLQWIQWLKCMFTLNQCSTSGHH